jgi:hypothetical protein
MILRSITQHVKDQNWFAVALDFIIVFVGVFVGLQVSNWNEAQTFDNREVELLHELKSEMENSILNTNNKSKSHAQVAAAGRRSLDFLASNESCDTQCWGVLVDFMHASQHQGFSVTRSTYDNMRRMGLPRKSAITKSVEAYLAQVYSVVDGFSEKPHYSAIVRQMMSPAALEFYWQNCWSVYAGVESYNLSCPTGVTADIALETVEAIAQNPEIKLYLTERYSEVVLIPIALGVQNTLAEQALAEIDAELALR